MEHIPKRRAKKFLYKQIEELLEEGYQAEVNTYKRKGKEMVKLILGSKEYTFYSWQQACEFIRKYRHIDYKEFYLLLV